MSLSTTTKGWVLVACALGVLGGAWAVASAFPVYFRADDVTYRTSAIVAG